MKVLFHKAILCKQKHNISISKLPEIYHLAGMIFAKLKG
jgi:hypothetical protein